MKVAHLSHSCFGGGAARAAYRIHQALIQAGVDSVMGVMRRDSDDWTVRGPTGGWNDLAGFVRPRLSSLVAKRLRSDNPILHSLALFRSQWPERLREWDADVVNLHWVTGEMLSIEDIARIQGPLAWTLHDMWPLCGAEHYSDDKRWQLGYEAANRPDHERGPDLCRWAWRRKRKAWRRPFHLVAPSTWLAECVAKSALFRDWPVRVIPYAVDTEAWAPVERTLARELLGLPSEKRLVLFGAMGNAALRIKGFDLLQEALRHLRDLGAKYELVVLGRSRPRESESLPFPSHYLGPMQDDLSLRCAYSAADVVAIPSRLDNLPNVGLEAMACGTPVVAFATCGLPDIVRHEETGWLARPFDTEDLAQGIAWCCEGDDRQAALRKAAREDAVARFSPDRVAAQYLAFYRELQSQPR